MKSSKSYLPRKLLAMALSFAVAFTWMVPTSLAVYAAEGDTAEPEVAADVSQNVGTAADETAGTEDPAEDGTVTEESETEEQTDVTETVNGDNQDEPAPAGNGEGEGETEEPTAGIATALPEAVDGTITLTGDVELAETAVITSDTTLDLAGHTISGPSGTMPTALSVEGGVLTVKDSSEAQAGKITVSGDYGMAVSGSVVMESGSIEATGKMAYAVNVPANGTATINGGSVSVSGSEAIAVNLPKGASAEMNGGVITADYTGSEGVNGVYVAGASAAFTMKDGEITVTGDGSKAIQLQGNNSKATLNGGKVTVNGANSAGVSSSPFFASQIDVTGGSISATGNRANAVFADESAVVNISGGTINSENSNAVSIYKSTTVIVTGGTIASKSAAGIAIASTGNKVDITGGTISGGTYGVQIGNADANTVTVSEEAKNNISGETGAINATLIKDPENGAYIAMSGAYVLMNIPYAKFYEAEGVSGVDSVTSATVKTYNQTMAGGSYHAGYENTTDESGKVTGEILGVTYPVYVENIDALDGLTAVTDDSTATITVAAGKSAVTTKEVSGADLLFASGDYAYYVMAGAPANYKTLTVNEDGSLSFSSVKNAAEDKTYTSAKITYGGHYTPVTLSFAADEIKDDSVVTAIIIKADGQNYALRHVENVWRKTELGWYWTDFDGKGLAGKTITDITYYTKDGGVYHYAADLLVKQPAEGTVAAEFEDANTVAVTGLPADIGNAKATVATKVGRGQTPVVIADNVAVTDGKVALTEAAAHKTTYTVKVVSDNYADIAAEATYVDAKQAAEEASADASEKAEAAAAAKEAAEKAKAEADEAAKTPGPEAVAAARNYQDAVKALTEAAAAAKEAADNAYEAAKKAYAEGSDELNAAKAAAENAEAAQTEAAAAAKEADDAVAAAQKAADDKAAADKKAAEEKAAAEKAAAEKAAAAKKAAEIKANNGTLDKSMPKVSIKGPKKAKKSFTAKWKKLSKKNQKAVKGIEVEYALDKNFTKSVKFKTTGKTKTSVKIKKLQSKKTYYVRVHTYKVVKGVKYVSPWSAVKKVKVK